jgi:uncharacterized protein (DUF2236 family)
MDGMYASLEVSEVGKELIGFILDPTLAFGLHLPLLPVTRLLKLTTLGTLPTPIRDQLDVRWSSRDQARYDRFRRTARLVFRATPRPIRVAPVRAYGRVLVTMAQRQVDKFEATQRSKAADQEALAS